MHYTEIEMAESMSTPTTISARNPVCKLCGGSQESGYMIRILSTAGLSKVLYSKFYKTTDIKISEDDTRSAVLCRSGVTFVDKMDQFIRRAQFVNNTPSDLNSEYSVKRCVQLSPSSHQLSKRLSKDMPPESFDVDELAIKGGWQAYTTFTSCQNATCYNMFFASAVRLCSGRFYIFTKQMLFHTEGS